jgi:hypothetical protein
MNSILLLLLQAFLIACGAFLVVGVFYYTILYLFF